MSMTLPLRCKDRESELVEGIALCTQPETPSPVFNSIVNAGLATLDRPRLRCFGCGFAKQSIPLIFLNSRLKYYKALNMPRPGCHYSLVSLSQQRTTCTVRAGAVEHTDGSIPYRFCIGEPIWAYFKTTTEVQWNHWMVPLVE